MHRRRKDSGFTLLEVAIALVTMSVLALGVMLAFTTSGTQDRTAYETTRNQNVCVAMMEQVEAMTFSGLTALAGEPLEFPIDRWTFNVTVTQVQFDLLSIETTSAVTADGSGAIRLTTLKARKAEAN